jgi:hypothetical protein
MIEVLDRPIPGRDGASTGADDDSGGHPIRPLRAEDIDRIPRDAA